MDNTLAIAHKEILSDQQVIILLDICLLVGRN